MTLNGLLHRLAATELMELDACCTYRVRPLEGSPRRGDVASELVENVGRGNNANVGCHEMRRNIVQRLQVMNMMIRQRDCRSAEMAYAGEKRELLVLPLPGDLIGVDRVPAVDARAGPVRRDGCACVEQAGVWEQAGGPSGCVGRGRRRGREGGGLVEGGVGEHEMKQTGTPVSDGHDGAYRRKEQIKLSRQKMKEMWASRVQAAENENAGLVVLTVPDLY